MAYRFKLSESFDKGVRRIGLEQIDRAISELTAAAQSKGSVHESRKSLKRIRALLRLTRSGIGKDVFSAENTRYRDIGRQLAKTRDREVLIATLGRFKDTSSGEAKTAFAAAEANLHIAAAGEAANGTAQSITAAIDALGEGRKVMENLAIEGGYSVAWAGVERTYRRAVDSFERAYETGHAEDLHEWRKSVQHHWRHMALLKEAWPEETEARLATAKEISELLGEDHDICVMIAAMETGGDAAAGPVAPPKGRGARSKSRRLTGRDRKLTGACAANRQQELRMTCRVLGERLFGEPADAFANRLKHYWQSGAKAEEARTAPAGSI